MNLEMLMTKRPRFRSAALELMAGAKGERNVWAAYRNEDKASPNFGKLRAVKLLRPNQKPRLFDTDEPAYLFIGMVDLKTGYADGDYKA